MVLEVWIGMAKCFRAEGKLEEARAALRDAREKNGDWGTYFDNIEADASKLIVEVNREILERDQKKLQQR